MSSVVFAMSALIAAADILLMHLLDPASIALELGGPIVDLLAGSSSGAGASSDAVSFLVVGTFLLAALFASASAVSGVAAGIWLLTRWRQGEGPSRVGDAMVGAGEAGRKRLEQAHRRGSVGLERARDGAASRYEDAKPVVRRVAREGRTALNEEVAPRVSTSIRKGAAWGREWIRARRADQGRDG